MENPLQQVQRQVRILNRLAEISLVLNSTWELDALLGYLMDAAAEITDSEAAAVLLMDPQTRDLRFAATTTRQATPNLAGQSVPLDSIAGMALQNNEIVQVDDALHDPRHYEGVDEQNRFVTRSLLAIPMRVKDNVIGVLEVVNKHQLPWTDEDREYSAVLAAQAAVAIETTRLVAALQAANRELSELDKMKNDFIAIASHELRTPVAVMLGYASFLQDEAEGKLSEHVAKVVTSGLQLRAIIEDLTNLRYLHQSAAELQCGMVSLVEIMEEAIQDVLKTAEAKGHKLTVQYPDENLMLNVDYIRVVMALTNLLNNAIRFTPDGGQIALRGEAHAGEAWVTVTDNGIGLADNQLERVFEKFYQVEDHMTRKHGGLGIGLSIVRALVEAHGGRVWATSAGLGQGAAFTVALPLADST